MYEMVSSSKWIHEGSLLTIREARQECLGDTLDYSFRGTDFFQVHVRNRGLAHLYIREMCTGKFHFPPTGENRANPVFHPWFDLTPVKLRLALVFPQRDCPEPCSSVPDTSSLPGTHGPSAWRVNPVGAGATLATQNA
jgi:hypothetical protein